MSIHSEIKRVTTATVQKMKNDGVKFSMVTCYDYTFAKIIDESGIDMILVGDSAANVMMGYDTTLPITIDDMITFASSVVRGAKRAMVVCDMPFGTYQGDAMEAYTNAVKIVQKTGVQALKLEGGKEIVEAVKKLVHAGIPVVGHLGLTPQSINVFGGFGLRAKDDDEANLLMENARLLEQAGAFAIVLEKVPASLAGKVAKELRIPIIGIGAGNQVDGQVLVMQDMIGLNDGFAPKFLRKFADLKSAALLGFQQYHEAVKQGDFPNEKEMY